MRISEITSLGVGAEAEIIDADSETHFCTAIAAADREGRALAVVGGGSNVVGPSDPYQGVVLRAAWGDGGCISRPIKPGDTAALSQIFPELPAETAADFTRDAFMLSNDSWWEDNDIAFVRRGAGDPWEQVVSDMLAAGMTGFEALSGIPGCVGAAPVQNIGAYGAEVGQFLVGVRAWDRATAAACYLSASTLRLGYRDSIIKTSRYDYGSWAPPEVAATARGELKVGDTAVLSRPALATGRWVITAVYFAAPLTSRSAPIRYQQLATALGVKIGEQCDPQEVRAAVRELRAGKGMLLGAAKSGNGDFDTRSAGSFFTNPIVPAAMVPAGAPVYPHGEFVKTSAAWLIDHAGYGKGFGLPEARARLSSRHVLAVTTIPGAKAHEVYELAAQIIAGVRKSYGITLVPEPVFL